jgi:hypothetical protein
MNVQNAELYGGRLWESDQLEEREMTQEDKIKLDLTERGCDDGTGSGSCPMTVFVINAVEATADLQCNTQ